ncbi:MAG: hypothetical protein M3406_02805 [Chloroflexota bacterium]|nr:hypothetical protein [Chloroflexota bacterium]
MRPITMAEQEFAMLEHRPAITRMRRKPWVWRCVISARSGGQVYVIDIEGGFRSGGGVKLWCREPALVPEAVTGRPPHTFADGSLCVNDRTPNEYEFIAFTTVPWLYSWLFFYEHWLDTGEWVGPQVEGHEVGGGPSAPTVKESPSAPKAPRPPSPKRTRGEAA